MQDAVIEKGKAAEAVAEAEAALAKVAFKEIINDPSVIVFSEINRWQHPHSTQFFQKAEVEETKTALLTIRTTATALLNVKLPTVRWARNKR